MIRSCNVVLCRGCLNGACSPSGGLANHLRGLVWVMLPTDLLLMPFWSISHHFGLWRILRFAMPKKPTAKGVNCKLPYKPPKVWCLFHPSETLPDSLRTRCWESPVHKAWKHSQWLQQRLDNGFGRSGGIPLLGVMGLMRRRKAEGKLANYLIGKWPEKLVWGRGQMRWWPTNTPLNSGNLPARWVRWHWHL